VIGLHKNISSAYFDGIRGIAVLLVWLCHTSRRDQAALSWLSFHGIGLIGVMLFFVLSGYLLSMPITSEKKFHFRTYILRRFLRIAPLYYLVIISVYLYQQYTGNISDKYLHVNDGFFGLIKHLFFIKGDSLFWTIPAEFVNYLILPVLAVYLIRQRYKALTFLTIASVAYSFYHFLIYAKILTFPGLKIVDIKHASQFLDVFVVGVIFGFLSHDDKAKSLYKRNARILDVLALCSFVITIFITFALIAKHFIIFNQPLYQFKYISVGYAFSFGFILLSTHHGNTILRNIFQLKIFVFCGIVGYSWYLLHLPVLAFTNGFDLPSSVKLLISTALISMISLAGYLFIEEPFIKIGKALTLNSITHMSRLPVNRQ
jgi:peptidoglycan/LPS O-acetylase OafA/YrhL